MKPFRMLIAAAAMLVFLSVVHAEDRTWTDREGKFQIEAMLLDFDGKDVKLRKKENGKTVSIPLEKLSLPDQAYVKKTMDAVGGSAEKSDSPFEEADDDAPPPKQKPKPAKPAKSEDDDNADAGGDDNADGSFKGRIPLTRLSTAPVIRTENATTAWSAKPDPAKHRELGFKPVVLDFKYGKVEFSTHVNVGGIFFCDDMPEKMLATATLDYRNGKATRVFFGDLKTGLILSQTWPVSLKPFGLSPDGTRALFGQVKERFNEITHLTVSDMTKPKQPCIAVFHPFGEKGGRSGSDAELNLAAWVDNDHILVKSRRDVLALIRVKDGSAVWSLEGGVFDVMTLSPGRKYVITHGPKSSYVLLETLTGKPIGLLCPPNGEKFPLPPTFAFSPNGEKIAAQEGGFLYLWEMKDGSAKEPFYIGSNVGRDLNWVSDVHVLCGGTLVETVEQLPIWIYSGVDSKDTFFAGRLWHASHPWSRDTSFYVSCAEIPHPGMPKLPKLADSVKYCLRPGLNVKLTVDDSIPDSLNLRQHVTKTLAANGLKVVADAPLVLAVRMKAEAPTEITYSTHFFHGQVGKATYTPYEYSYSLEQGGKPVWAISSKSGAPSVSVNDLAGNRSLQDVVSEKSGPNSSWYFGVRIPKKIAFDKAGKSVLFK